MKLAADANVLLAAVLGGRVVKLLADHGTLRAMKLTIELSQAQADRLDQEARRLQITPEELAVAALSDLLSTSDEDFKAAAERVLRNNRELYRRLA